jgi:hypothetical protein
VALAAYDGPPMIYVHFLFAAKKNRELNSPFSDEFAGKQLIPLFLRTAP